MTHIRYYGLTLAHFIIEHLWPHGNNYDLQHINSAKKAVGSDKGNWTPALGSPLTCDPGPATYLLKVPTFSSTT